VFEFPLWAFVLTCSPFAATALGLGVVAQQFARRPIALGAIWATLALTILGLGYGAAATLAYGWNPWEGTADPSAGEVYAASFLAVLGVGWCLLVVARRAELPK
jgi:hypothetical protein